MHFTSPIIARFWQVNKEMGKLGLLPQNRVGRPIETGISLLGVGIASIARPLR
jgi:hypothetical protein